MAPSLRSVALWPFVVAALCAQTVSSPTAPAPQPVAPVRSAAFVRGILADQKAIVTSPARLRAPDLKWLVPLVGSAAWLAASDRRNMRERIHTNSQARDRSLTVSSLGVGALAAVPAYLYWQGWRHADTYSQRTGLLSARAVVDTVIAAEFLRGITRRERPMDGAGTGGFFTAGGISSSFPSVHSGVAWAIASVIARRYPGWFTQASAYGLAGAVSVSRVTAREHFPSDVLVGSALGFLIGRFVSAPKDAASQSREEPAPASPVPSESPASGRPAASSTPGGSLHAWQAPPAAAPALSDAPSSGPSGSSYVPLESWVYGALDRLASFGLIPSQISGLRPWTRDECRRQMQEAEANLQSAPDAGYADQAAGLLASLGRELGSETPPSGLVLESVYLRNGFIAGSALNDSFHFGQTWIDDSGRPYGRGWNSYEGFTARAESGRFFGYVQGEYQHAPGAAAYSLPVRQAISAMDGIPLQQANPVPSTDRFRLLDTYVGMRLGDLEFSVGKQSMWWGPSYDAPLSFSDNAEPTKNLKISTVHPFHVWPFKEVRGEFVMGKLGGQKYTWRPWFNALKVSFKLTDNLEMGFTRWSILWGVGHPIDPGSFIRNWTSMNSPSQPWATHRTDPGDRKGGFDFRYRVPGLRNWLTLYTDSYCDDDPSPLANPRRAAISPGIYLARVPGLPRLDFRVEAPSTSPLDPGWDYLGLNYYNNQYRSGNTNYGNLLGNPIGRDARAIEAWSTYHLSPRSQVELGFRRLKGSNKTIPGGSSQSDATFKTSFALAPDWHADVFMQYEKFFVPLLGPRRSNVSGWLQLSWEPKLQILGKRN